MSLLDDTRIIESIIFDDSEACSIADGHIDDITVERVEGQMGYVPWFVCWKGGKVVSRWNAALVQGVVYAS